GVRPGHGVGHGHGILLRFVAFIPPTNGAEGFLQTGEKFFGPCPDRPPHRAIEPRGRATGGPVRPGTRLSRIGHPDPAVLATVAPVAGRVRWRPGRNPGSTTSRSCRHWTPSRRIR